MKCNECGKEIETTEFKDTYRVVSCNIFSSKDSRFDIVEVYYCSKECQEKLSKIEKAIRANDVHEGMLKQKRGEGK